MLLRGRAGVTCGVPQLTPATASTTSFAMPEQPLPRRASCMGVMLGICSVAMLPTDFQVLQGISELVRRKPLATTASFRRTGLHFWTASTQKRITKFLADK